MSLESSHTSLTTKDVLIKKLGRYEILSELGKGAMGIVYKAVDPLIDRTVAIKTINLNLSGDEIAGFVKRFNREAKSAGRLNHPNIVTIYDVGRADDTAFIAMEYLEGQELKEIIASKQTLQPERIVEMTAQVADALAFAHDHGVVHRDIKPANIMVLRNGVVKIMDFGIAMTSSGSQTQAGTILGSPIYMSPEQVSGTTVDGRSDIFSLGAVLYELLTGISVFGGENSTLTSIMYQVINEMPNSPTSVNPSIPVAFDYIVAKAMAKEPEHRYQSAREMADDLRNFKTLATSTPLPFQASSEKRSGEYSGKEGDATLVLDTNKPLAVPGSSKRKKLIGVATTAIFFIVIALFIYAQREPAKTATDDKESAIGQKALAPTAKPMPSIPTEVKTPVGQKALAPTAKPMPSIPTEVKVPEGQSEGQENPKIAAPTPANLNFAVLPWGEVFIDGKRLGASPPLKEIKLSPGKHRIEIKNAAFPPYRQTLKLEAGESMKIRHKFN
jgi:serine/threonine-protein kinase